MQNSPRNSRQIKLWDVSPRDGLQNEATPVPTEAKLQLIGKLLDAGMRNIEITACVSSKWVPQMADHAAVIAGVADFPVPHDFAVLVPNGKGMTAAAATQVSTIAVFTAASEEFTKRNINCTIAESLLRFKPISDIAGSLGKSMRGYVSTAVACPYSGRIEPKAVAAVSQQLFDMGCQEISLGDTIGIGKPSDIEGLLDVVTRLVPIENIACHFHDTYGNALANIRMSLSCGVRIFDSAVGGLGGCPYAPGAPGNVDTVAVVKLLADEGYHTKVNVQALNECASWVRERLAKAKATP